MWQEHVKCIVIVMKLYNLETLQGSSSVFYNITYEHLHCKKKLKSKMGYPIIRSTVIKLQVQYRALAMMI